MSKHVVLNATLILVANTLLILAGVFMILVAAGTSFTSSTLSYTLPAWPTTSDNTVTKTQNTIIQYSFYAFGGILIASGVSAIVFLQRWWRRLDYTPVLFLFHATLCGLAELVALAALVFAILATVMASRNANVTTDTPAVVSGGTANATSRWAYLCIASGVVFLVNSVAFFGAVAEHRAKIRQRRDLYVTEINASSPPEHTSGLADTKWMARMSESHSAKMYLDDNAGAARRKPSGAGGGAVAGIALTAPSLSASSSVTPYGPSGGVAGGGSARSNHYYGQERNSLYAYPGPHQLYQQQQQQQSYSHQSAPYGYPLATAAAAAATSAAVVGGSGRGGRSNSAYYYPSGSTNDPYNIQQPSIQPRVQQPDWDYSAHYTEELYPDYYHQSYQAQTYPAPQQHQHQQQTLLPPPPPSAQLDRRETRNLYSPLPFVEPALGVTTTKSGGASTYEYRPPPSPTVDEYGIRSSHHHHHSHPNAMRLDGDDDADTHVDGLSPAPPRRRGVRQQLASSSSSYDLSRDSEAETRHDEEEEEEVYEDDVDDRSDVFGVVRGRDILPPRADPGGGGVSNTARQDRRNSDDFDGTRTNLTTTTTTTTARQQKEYEDTSSSVAGYAGSFYNSRRAGWVGASTSAGGSGVGSDVVGGGGAPHVLLAGHDQRARDSNVRYI
ncbi:hypothetical protein HDU89_000510 [Geranomyces variabilis]|nr:hypothetical protein HDU89_000510 [Geranomyces variabilis]